MGVRVTFSLQYLSPEFFVLVSVKCGKQEVYIEACVGLHALPLFENTFNVSRDASFGRAD
jgi:hypothetical protein